MTLAAVESNTLVVILRMLLFLTEIRSTVLKNV